MGAEYAAHMDRGLTQEKMAKAAKLSVPYVSRIERGKKKASISAFYGTLFVCSIRVRPNGTLYRYGRTNRAPPTLRNISGVENRSM